MPKRALSAILVASALALAGCGGQGENVPAAAAVDASAPSRVEEWTLPPTLPGSASPSLSVTPDGRLLLGWTNSQKGRRHIFQFSSYAPDWGRWMHQMSTVAIGNRMFVNWADVPHLLATPDGALWAHWLQKSGDAPYAYDVVLSRSRDGGANWAPPVLAHDDGTRTEHGFVSMWAHGADALGMAWLDGRHTGGGHGGHDGAMTLRAAVFDASLARSGEVEIDPRVCDCCQTAVAMTARGPLLVYRGRGADEVRDILATRHDGSGWRPPARRAGRGRPRRGCGGGLVHRGRRGTRGARGRERGRRRPLRRAGHDRRGPGGAGPGRSRARRRPGLDPVAARGRRRAVAVAVASQPRPGGGTRTHQAGAAARRGARHRLPAAGAGRRRRLGGLDRRGRRHAQPQGR